MTDSLSSDVGPVLSELLQRNRGFVTERHTALGLAPRLKTCVVACPDPRVDPAHVLGLELGDAAVVRAAGGRISPIVLQQLLFLAQTAAAAGQSQEGLELVLMQHTDCGMAHFTGPEYREMLGVFLGCEPHQLAEKALTDPHEGVRVDIRAVASNPLLPASLSVTGVVYDVFSGAVEVVERRSPLRAEEHGGT